MYRYNVSKSRVGAYHICPLKILEDSHEFTHAAAYKEKSRQESCYISPLPHPLNTVVVVVGIK